MRKIKSIASLTRLLLYDAPKQAFLKAPKTAICLPIILTKARNGPAFFGVDMHTTFGVASVGLSLSRFNLTQYFQANAGLRYYPLGNLKLYGSTTCYFLSGDEDPHLIVAQQIGFQAFKNMWIETYLSHGNHSYMNKDNGYLILNTAYQTKTRLEITLFAKIAKQAMFRIGYVNQKGTHPFQSYNSATDSMTEFYHDYQTHSIVGGIQWTL